MTSDGPRFLAATGYGGQRPSTSSGLRGRPDAAWSQSSAGDPGLGGVGALEERTGRERITADRDAAADDINDE